MKKLFSVKTLLLFIGLIIIILAASVYVNKYSSRSKATQPAVNVSFSPSAGSYNANEQKTLDIILQPQDSANKISGIDLKLSATGNAQFIDVETPSVLSTGDTSIFSTPTIKNVANQEIHIAYILQLSQSQLPNAVKIRVLFKGTDAGSGNISVDSVNTSIVGNISGNTYSLGTLDTGAYTFSPSSVSPTSPFSPSPTPPVPNNSLPTIDSVTISSSTVIPDGTTLYTIYATASDPNGAGDIYDISAMINNQGENAGAYRGHPVWVINDVYPSWPEKKACSGAGGWAVIKPGIWSQKDGTGPYYIHLESCSVTDSGNSRTVKFVVSFDPSYTTPLLDNDISGLAFSSGQSDYVWTNFQMDFKLQLLPTAISITPTPPPGCFYQQVQCVRASCPDMLVCPTPPSGNDKYTIDIGTKQSLSINIGAGVNSQIKFKAKLASLRSFPDLYLKLRVKDELAFTNNPSNTNVSSCNNAVAPDRDFYIPVRATGDVYSPVEKISAAAPTGAQLASVTPDGWVILDGVEPGRYYSLYLKGPKTRKSKMVEHFLLQPTQDSQDFDWTGKPLDPGDLPKPDKDPAKNMLQDCVVSSTDWSLEKERIGANKDNPDDAINLTVCDVNYDGICNAGDSVAILDTLSKRPDDDQ